MEITVFFKRIYFILHSRAFNILHIDRFYNNFCSSYETIRYLSKSNKSLIRWGDGETNILMGGSIKFQTGNEELQKNLHLILEGHSKDNAPYILAMPNDFLKKNKKELMKIKKYNVWKRTRYIFAKYSKQHIHYGDAFVFRPLSKLTNKDIEPLWLGKNVILVCSKENYFNNFKERYGEQKSFFVKIPEVNAFETFEETILKINTIFLNNGLTKTDSRVLIAGGPAAKVIIYNLSKESFICYDMGHYFEWKFYNKTNKKGI